MTQSPKTESAVLTDERLERVYRMSEDMQRHTTLEGFKYIMRFAKAGHPSLVTLSALQLREAMEFAAPDFDNDEVQRETEVSIGWAEDGITEGDGGEFFPAGYRVWLTEYPEEGCIPLDDTEKLEAQFLAAMSAAALSTSREAGGEAAREQRWAGIHATQQRHLPLIKAAVELLAACHERLDTLPSPHCYSIPYAQVKALQAALTASPQPATTPSADPALAVWFGSMPESNGKENWTAILHAGDLAEGDTIDRSEYRDRVRYHADCVRYLIGELKERPDILAYDDKLHSGYVEPAATKQPAGEVQKAVAGNEHDQILEQLDEISCPRCLGTQCIPAMSDNGPDAYEVDVCCDHCGGSGTAKAAYTSLADFSRKAITELTQLRYYRWYTEDQKKRASASPPPAAPAVPPGMALEPKYAEAIKALASQQNMTEAQIINAAIRLYQAERNGKVNVEHLRESKESTNGNN